ncbi:hypothetical protein V8E53_005915 [Lactarius tabidus]
MFCLIRPRVFLEIERRPRRRQRVLGDVWISNGVPIFRRLCYISPSTLLHPNVPEQSQRDLECLRTKITSLVRPNLKYCELPTVLLSHPQSNRVYVRPIVSTPSTNPVLVKPLEDSTSRSSPTSQPICINTDDVPHESDEIPSKPDISCCTRVFIHLTKMSSAFSTTID